MYLCLTELFEIELFICIKMDLELNNLQRLICHKTQTNKQVLKPVFMTKGSFIKPRRQRYPEFKVVHQDERKDLLTAEIRASKF